MVKVSQNNHHCLTLITAYIGLFKYYAQQQCQMKSKIWLSLKLKSATVLKVEAVYLFVAVYLEMCISLLQNSSMSLHKEFASMKRGNKISLSFQTFHNRHTVHLVYTPNFCNRKDYIMKRIENPQYYFVTHQGGGCGLNNLWG